MLVMTQRAGNDEVKTNNWKCRWDTFTFDKKYNTVFCYGKEVVI